jgi:DNA replication and repair protein RecF
VRVRALRTLHFRNLQAGELAFAPGLTFIVGSNGAGKSNLLDAIYLGATGDLPDGRAATSLRFGTEEGFVGLEIDAVGGSYAIEVGLAAQRRRLRLDGRAIRPSEVARLGGAVRIAPEDADMIHGPPALRRGYLDDLLARLSLRFASLRRSYLRVVEQRNAALREVAMHATLPAWDDRFVAIGVEIDALRGRALQRIAALAADAYAQIAADGKELGVTLRRAAGGRPLAEALAASRSEERARGVTVVGPHRDDLDLTLAGQLVRSSGSRGEARSTALALRLAEYRLMEERHGAPPVLLVDDLMAELDARRRGFVLALAERAPQALVTGTDAPPEAARVWRIAQGEVTT